MAFFGQGGCIEGHWEQPRDTGGDKGVDGRDRLRSWVPRVRMSLV
jgi:hypothetical protein